MPVWKRIFVCLIVSPSDGTRREEPQRGLLGFFKHFGIHAPIDEVYKTFYETSHGRRGGGTCQKGDENGRDINEGQKVNGPVLLLLHGSLDPFWYA